MKILKCIKIPIYWYIAFFLGTIFLLRNVTHFNLAAPLSSSRVYPEELRTKKPTVLGREWPVDAVLALG